jgi:NitT/TauT family transport system permease protein
MNALRGVRDYSISVVFLIAIWWVAAVPMGLPGYLLPSPMATAGALWEITRSGEIFVHLGYTLQNLLLGLLVGLIAGTLLAYLLTRSVLLTGLLEGPLVILQTAPKIALAPLFIVWFGFGITSKIVLVFSLAFFPVLVGAMTGFAALDPRLADLAKLYQMGPLKRLWNIELPAALPDIFAGIRVAAVQALVGAVLGEWMAGQLGLGYLMTLASATYKTPLLFAAVALTVLVGVLLHVGVGWAESRLLHWKERAHG